MTNREDLSKKINSATFPGMQGGPLMHIIAAKAQCFMEALEPSFKVYIAQVLKNTKACADELRRLGASVSDTETHLFLMDTKSTFGMTGVDVQDKVEEIGITLNKNMIPKDTEKPMVTSGVRIGFAATTTRGLDEKGARTIGKLIFDYLKGFITKDAALTITKNLVSSLKKVDEI